MTGARNNPGKSVCRRDAAWGVYKRSSRGLSPPAMAVRSLREEGIMRETNELMGRLISDSSGPSIGAEFALNSR